MFYIAIVKRNDKRSRYGYYQLTTMLVGMPSTVRATRNVISPIDPTDGERHFLYLFRHRKISSWIHYLWEVH